MHQYKKNDARAWAREHLKGCSAVTIPSYTSDLRRLNQSGIRHDIDLVRKLGFSYTLLCTEVAITPQENALFTSIARESAGSEFGIFFHAAFGTLSENIEAVKLAEKSGADIVLLSYPSQFWPNSEREIYDYTRELCDATELAVMLFPLPLWGFERVHPAGMSVDLVRRLLRDCPNIVAIKAEQGYPLIGGVCEMYHHFREEVVISCPIESDAIPLMGLMKLQFSGTSNTQWMSDYYPRAFALAREGKFAEAMELYWQVSPARNANAAGAHAYIGGTSVLNRTMWKYQDWLAGFNGGPLRAPAMRVPDKFMKGFRQGLQASGLPVTDDPDHMFIVGRHPD
ncbi:UNVERIFIED_ORG: 4-hydroxy-tetrahydrodipicolinate synthase [Xanthobacter viscosus]|uniref:Dihydrodipicolinate synthase family protein n=1 Tax=Xanthobacter autotrophicus TaxID=280 RepID=A0A6C1KPF1_XANAU|nr:dihydrodipicolinate synthase family protein [Xanthobacter autotrophicus]TLX41396.1 dihydrodipicolinate synthase family protein [Xanthobacter autotrophicus]